MWNNYFAQIRKKYSMRLSTKKPLIINLDGKNATKNQMLNLIVNYENGFLQNMEKTVEYFTRRYNCIAIFGADEVSFIFLNPAELVADLNSDNNYYSNEIISVFSQYFFDYFNSISKKEKIFWHGKCFSIPQEKVISYIKYKQELIRNLVTTYFLKKKGITNVGRIKSIERIEKCKEFKEEYEKIREIENGILYFDGNRIDIQEYLNGNIKPIESLEKNKYEDYFDITKWNEE